MSREKQREALIRERERLQMEVAEMRRRLETSRVYQTELERKNSAADNKVLNLEQQIEVLFIYYFLEELINLINSNYYKVIIDMILVLLQNRAY